MSSKLTALLIVMGAATGGLLAGVISGEITDRCADIETVQFSWTPENSYEIKPGLYTMSAIVHMDNCKITQVNDTPVNSIRKMKTIFIPAHSGFMREVRYEDKWQ